MSAKQFAAILLAGGQSARMGAPKCLLPFRGEPLIRHVQLCSSAAVPTVIVVAAVGQELPTFPPNVRIAYDETPHAGPLAGFATGLAALPEDVDAVFLAACDTPLLHPAFVTHLLAALGDHRAAVPSSGGRLHPLAAAYRRAVRDTVLSLLSAGQRSMAAPLAAINPATVTEYPHAESLRNVNTPADYAALVEDDTPERRT